EIIEEKSSDDDKNYTKLLEEQRHQKMDLMVGINLFNKKPEKGLEYFIKHKKLNNSPKDIAIFLKSTEGLNKKMIGEYIGKKSNIQVLHEFVGLFDFFGMHFVEAMR